MGASCTAGTQALALSPPPPPAGVQRSAQPWPCHRDRVARLSLEAPLIPSPGCRQRLQIAPSPCVRSSASVPGPFSNTAEDAPAFGGGGSACLIFTLVLRREKLRLRKEQELPPRLYRV